MISKFLILSKFFLIFNFSIKIIYKICYVYINNFLVDLRKRKSCPSCNKSISGLEKVIEGGLSNKTKDEELSNVWMGIGKTKHFLI